MGIFQNKINGVGTFLKESLEDKLQTTQGDSIAEKLNSIRGELQKQGITSTTGGYRFSVSYSEKLDSIEAVFDFQGNSGGGDTQGLQQAIEGLKKKKWSQKEENKSHFSYGRYEIRLEGEKVYFSSKYKTAFTDEKFEAYLKASENVFNYLIGGAKQQSSKPTDQEVLKQQTESFTKEDLYDKIVQKLGNKEFKGDKAIVTNYGGRRVNVLIGGIDSSRLLVQIKLNLTMEQANKYKESKPLDDYFDLIGTNCGTCIREGVSQANTMEINGLLKRLVAAYEGLKKKYPSA